MNEIETLKLIQEQMLVHFQDDSRNFDRINKTAEKHEELMIVNGDHLSNIRKDMNKYKDVQEKILALLEANSEKIEENRKATEPIILSYNKDLIIKQSDTSRGDRVIRWSILAGSIVGIGAFLTWVHELIKFTK